MARRKHRRAAHHENAHKRRHGRMHYNRRYSRHSRRYHRNAPGMWQDAAMGTVAGLAALAIAKKGGEIVGRYMPLSIPQGPLIAEAGAALAVGVLGAMFLPSRALKEGAIVGAGMAFAFAVIPHNFQQALGWQNVVMLPPPKAGGESMGAAYDLSAALEAEVDESAY